MEPTPETQSILAVLGLKLGSVVGGFAGALASLSFITGLTTWKAILVLITGTVSASYITPVVVRWVGMTGDLENGFAFLVGLTAMNVLAGVLKMSERFRSRPEDFIGPKSGNSDTDQKGGDKP